MTRTSTLLQEQIICQAPNNVTLKEERLKGMDK